MTILKIFSNPSFSRHPLSFLTFNDNHYMDLGQTIKKLREQRGLKQNTFAEKCDLSPAYLSQIENNQKDPNLSTIREISASLGIPLPILFFLSLDESDIPEKKREAFKMMSPVIKNMIQEFFLKSNEDNRD